MTKKYYIKYMSNTRYMILLAIVWICVGGTMTLFATRWFWNTQILPDMYESLDECWEERLDLIQ